MQDRDERAEGGRCLEEGGAGGQVRLVELVGHIPADWAKLAALLHHAVQEAHDVQQLPPVRAVHRVQHILLPAATMIC